MTDITTQPSTDAAAGTAADAEQAPAAPAKKAARKRAPRKKVVVAEPTAEPGTTPAVDAAPAVEPAAAPGEDAGAPVDEQVAPVKKAARKRASRAKKVATPAPEQPSTDELAAEDVDAPVVAVLPAAPEPAATAAPAEPPAVEPPAVVRPAAGAALLFQAPEPAPPRRRRRAQAPEGPPVTHEPTAVTEPEPDEELLSAAPAVPATEIDTEMDAEIDLQTDAPVEAADESEEPTEDAADAEAATEGGRKRRRRGGRGRRGRSDEDPAEDAAAPAAAEPTDAAEAGDGSDAPTPEQDADDDSGSSSSRRRRRRRRRAGSTADETTNEDPPGTVTKVRQPRKADDEVTSIKGSTRLEAKKQRRRDGRDAGRRKPIITESEFLARRESVERTMIVRESRGRTQIAVLEDDVLVEHYVANESNASMIGNVYLGRVQNVLPSMEAAFIDIGKGRNAVLYAGEVNWDAAGLEGGPRRIEVALKSGDQVLVQVTKDPMGHKGARLTSQISLPGRYLVYVPNGSMTGISRKLPDTERARLKKILKAVVPEQAGVIVRTAAEGASEEELQRDVERLTAQWADIEKRSKSSSGGTAPKLLHGEPDLTVRVIRDVFNEDFAKLVVSGASAWDVVQPYVGSVAADLAGRVSKWTSQDDVFAAFRVDEQLTKAMDRKVWLPSGGSLVIDRTEAMTVVDVNTGKFTGAGGNLEETVTRNNLEAAEEMVRQLRLRDIGGIIVIDFIDMVLESNRDLVMRRLLECLGRDRTKHQVAEVTSLGLVQMTRKRVGQGLLEVFSESCEHCNGRGLLLHADPIQTKGNGGAPAPASPGGSKDAKAEPSTGRGRGRSRSKGGDSSPAATTEPAAPPRQPIPAGLVASLAQHHDGSEPSPGTGRAEPTDPASQPAQAPAGRQEPATVQATVKTPVQTPAQTAVQTAVQPTIAVVPVEQPSTDPAGTAPAGGPLADVDLAAGTSDVVETSRPARRRRRASAPSGPPPAQG